MVVIARQGRRLSLKPPGRQVVMWELPGGAVGDPSWRNGVMLVNNGIGYLLFYGD